MYPKFQLFIASILVAFVFTIVGCSDSGDSTDNSGETVKTVGVVNSVNSNQSVSVNGVDYNTDESTVTNEEGGDLDVGMVVTVEGDMDEHHHTGKAHSIHYEAEIKGVVISNDIAADGTLNVMGQTVMVDDMTVYSGETMDFPTLDSIPVNAVVEVSGFMLGDGILQATRIELEHELYEVGMLLKVKGKITAVGDMFFEVHGLTVMYDENTVFHKFTQDDIEAGLYVKVSSRQVFNPETMNLMADAIKLKKHGMEADHGEKVEVYGVVTSDGVTEAMFMLNDDQSVMITEKTHYVHGTFEDIVQGAMLQAKGYINENDVLVAEKIKFKKPDNVKIMGPVDEVNPDENYLIVMGTMIYLDNMTWMKDHPHYAPNHPKNPEPMASGNAMDASHSFELGDIEPGNFVKVKAGYSNQGMLMAYKVERKKPDHPANAQVIGPVTAIDTDANLIEVAGVKVDVSGYGDMMIALGDKVAVVGDYDAETMILTPKEFEVEPMEKEM